MRTVLTFGAGPDGPLQKFNRRINGLLKYLAHQKRCLAVTAVILFVFVWLNLFPSSAKTALGLNVKETQQISGFIEEGAVNSLLNGFLGGPVNLSAAMLVSGQSGFDFSADDERENQEALFRGDSLIASANPSGGDVFAGLRRDVLTYIVQQGDTPFDIAIKFGLNTDTVLAANNMKDGDLIRPGDKLTILPINGVRIKIGAKDTLVAIAKKYSGKAEEIAAFNGLGNDGLKAGSFLIVPNGEMPVPVKSSASYNKFAKGSQTKVGGGLIWPTTGMDWGRIHGRNGVDIANACGTPVYAAAAGRVEIADGAGWNWGYGKYIQIQHPGGTETLYAHNSRLLAGVGEQVQQGQLIALMGTTGNSTGCHLHFEVHGASNPLAKR